MHLKRRLVTDLLKRKRQIRTRRLESARLAGMEERAAFQTVGTTPRTRRLSSETKGPIRVLVVEDEGRVRDAAVHILLRRGMIVHKVAKPTNLVQTIRRFRPDVMVLDDYFERSGVEFSKLMPSILGQFPAIPVIVTSNSDLSQLSFSDNPFNWGASDVVQKSDILRSRKLDESVMSLARK